jgi:hypothetical protein
MARNARPSAPYARERAARRLDLIRQQASAGIGRKVRHGPRPMGREGALEVALLAQIAPAPAAPFDRPLMAAFEVVERDGEVAGTRQRLAGVAADKAGPAGDENRLHGISCGNAGQNLRVSAR